MPTKKPAKKTTSKTKAPVKATSKTRTTVKKAPKSESSSVDLQELIKTTTVELLAKVAIEATVAVEPLEETGYSVQLDSPDASLIIGYHGQTLSAFQLILGLAVQRLSGSWVRLVINVGDYRQRREEQLRHLAQSVAQRVRFSGQAQTLAHLTAAERRIVHLTLAEDDMVETVSEGEGTSRHLIIRPKHPVS